MTTRKKLFVISDLHLGGAPPSESSRGFRMMKHPDKLARFLGLLAAERTPECEVELVINGDFLDFLAEELPGPSRWSVFKYEAGSALAAFQSIAAGLDACVFAALRALLETCSVTIMLGNHDLELSLPEVRAALVAELGNPPPERLRFLEDGQGLIIGGAIIEHGNAHDPANDVDYARLRALRALRASGEYQLEKQEDAFRPPAGSELVVRVMNPLKERYAFVDLLKPESEAVFTLLYALEPEARGELGRLASLVRAAGRGLAARLGVGADGAPADDSEQMVALAEYVKKALPAELAHVEPPPPSKPSGALSWLESKLGLSHAASTGTRETLRLLLPEMRRAFSALSAEPTWRTDVEAGSRYREAAEGLAAETAERSGYRFVVFGHTHHAKRINLPNAGAVYLNSGTWANLMQFPKLPDDEEQALDLLYTFAQDCRDNNFDKDDRLLSDPEMLVAGRVRQIFNPTYVELDVGADGFVSDARLGVFDWQRDRLAP